MKNLVIIIAYIAVLQTMKAQSVASEATGPYKTVASVERKPVPWHKIIEADASFHWRVERVIDVRIKQNSPLQWPKNPLWALIKNNLDNGKLVAYATDSLTRKADLEQIYMKLNHMERVGIQRDPENPYDIT
ncbi:MAG: hypothetical protein HYZ42_11510, partial [Bacteroidetes bacterium]|nr:hypothetical protein [Bacteroidota bacterium]